MTRRTVLRTAPLALLALGAAVLAAPSAGAATAAPASPVFSRATVVDQQRTGFEPGIQVDSKDRLYTSVPYGFSNTQSFLWGSRDHGSSFQLVPGSVLTGKALTCVGGGDSELALDAKDDLFFSDLQGLTNLSNSVTKDQGASFASSCTASPNTPVDRMWYAVHGSLGDPDFAIYEEYDDVEGGLDPANPATNQLVETVSHDGVNFLPVLNKDLTSTGCLGGGALNCITDDEGIPGNQVLSKDGRTLYVAHTSADSNKVTVSIGTLTTDATGATSASWKTVPVNADVCPDKAGTPGPAELCGAALFATIAQDTAGGLYVVAAAAAQKGGTQTSPYSVLLWHSTDGGKTWGKASKASGDGSNAFPWITAGDPGRVDITYYHATKSSEGGKYAFDDLVHGSFTVQMAQSLDALSASPTFTRTDVSEHPIKYGPICTTGTTCTVSGGDRSLGDYLQVSHDARGAAVVAYVDDTSNAYSVGPAATGSQVANAGPTEVSRQVAGPGLFTGAPLESRPGYQGPGRASDTVSDPSGDSDYSANGTRTPTAGNLDLTGTSVKDDGKGGLVVTMKVKDLSSLTTSPATGGTTAEWITRFTTYNAGKTPGNGHILYAGMESVLGGAPTFFAGDVGAAPQLFLNFTGEKAVQGTYTKAGLITLHLTKADLAEVPAAKTVAERTLYSATGFTATTAGSLVGNPQGLFNLTDATPPFDHVVGARSATRPVVRPVAAPGSGSGPGSLPTTGLSTGLPLAGLGLLAAALVAARRRRTTV